MSKRPKRKLNEREKQHYKQKREEKKRQLDPEERRKVLAQEWHPSKNGSKKFEDYSNGSGVKLWWLCAKSCCGVLHEYEAKTRDRMLGSNCPFCTKRKLCQCRSLAALFPDLCLQWDYERNEKPPEEYPPYSNDKVHWVCLDSTCGHHRYEMVISNRTALGDKCPYCQHHRICPCVSFAAKFPDLAKDWHPTWNKKTADEYGPYSHMQAWFQCKRDPSHPHYRARITDRSRGGTNCQRCTKVQSLGERKTGEALTQVLPAHLITNQHSFPDLKSEKKALLRMDYGILPNPIRRPRFAGVEWDGLWHFPGNYGFTEEAQERDRLKNFYFAKHGYHLLRISESVPKRFLPQIVQRFIDRIHAADPTQTIHMFVGKEYDAEYHRTMMPTEAENNN